MKLYNLLPLSKRKLDILFEIYASNRIYLRELSRELNMSLSLCSRILNSLIKSKVLERKKEGKQIYYSIIEDYYKKILIQILEEYNLEKKAVKSDKLKIFINLVRANDELLDNCKKIYIFGSYARGIESKKDLDIFFIAKNKSLIAKFCRESSTILNLQVNGIVMDKNEFNKNLINKEPLTISITKEIKNRLVII